MATAIWGLLAGAAATVPMTLWEIPFHLRDGTTAVLEWHENQAVWARLLDRPVEELVLHGQVLHFTHGAVGGLVFAVVWPLIGLGWPLVAGGLGYGIILWLLTLLTHEAIAGVSAFDHPLGWRPAAVSLVGHLIYGAGLGLLLGWL